MVNYSVQEEKSNQEENHANLRQRQDQCLQSLNEKLKKSEGKFELITLELEKAQESPFLNEGVIEGIDAAGKALKEESDEKIRVMEIALDEEKLKTQISNNMSTMTQTELRVFDEIYLEEVSDETFDRHIRMTWEHFLELV